MKRLPAVLSLLLFLALCASLAYWLLQWLAPAPRPVAAPPAAQRSVPPLTEAYALFGGNPERSAPGVQLRGIIRSGRAADSVAIIAIEGKSPRALRRNAEVVPGMKLTEVRAKTVIVSDQGTERELVLPPFAALPAMSQEMSAPAQEPQAQPPVQPAQAQPPQGLPGAVPPAAPVQVAPAPASPPPAQPAAGTSAVGGNAGNMVGNAAGNAAGNVAGNVVGSGSAGGGNPGTSDAGPSARAPAGLRARNATNPR